MLNYQMLLVANKIKTQLEVSSITQTCIRSLSKKCGDRGLKG